MNDCKEFSISFSLLVSHSPVRQVTVYATQLFEPTMHVHRQQIQTKWNEWTKIIMKEMKMIVGNLSPNARLLTSYKYFIHLLFPFDFLNFSLVEHFFFFSFCSICSIFFHWNWLTIDKNSIFRLSRTDTLRLDWNDKWKNQFFFFYLKILYYFSTFVGRFEGIEWMFTRRLKRTNTPWILTVSCVAKENIRRNKIDQISYRLLYTKQRSLKPKYSVFYFFLLLFCFHSHTIAIDRMPR